MKHLGLAATLALVAGLAAAEPALIYSTGGKFDKSFNEAAHAGAERYKSETGESYAEFEPDSPAQSEQALRKFAQAGHSPVVAIGFLYADALAKVAPEFPGTRFVIVDMVVDAPNVRSVVYREQEGSYVVGLIAAMKSRTGKIGFVGGMDIPLIRKFACGYIQGVRAVSATAEVIVNMTGDTPAAWSDPGRGAELTRSQIDRGADIVMQAAGGTGVGVLQAAAEGGILGIGTDSNQNGLHPGKVFTSMLKRVDVAVLESFKAVKAGSWTPGIVSLGLREGGLDFAMDANNAPLMTPEILAALDKAKADIASGAVTVFDSSTQGDCPVR